MAEAERSTLRIEAQCNECGTYRDPSTATKQKPKGEFVQGYRPQGQLGVDYQLSCGVCAPCLVEILKRDDEIFKKAGL